MNQPDKDGMWKLTRDRTTVIGRVRLETNDLFLPTGEAPYAINDFKKWEWEFQESLPETPVAEPAPAPKSGESVTIKFGKVGERPTEPGNYLGFSAEYTNISLAILFRDCIYQLFEGKMYRMGDRPLPINTLSSDPKFNDYRWSNRIELDITEPVKPPRKYIVNTAASAGSHEVTLEYEGFDENFKDADYVVLVEWLERTTKFATDSSSIPADLYSYLNRFKSGATILGIFSRIKDEG